MMIPGKPMLFAVLVAAIAAICSPSHVWAERPFRTDDPFLVGRYRYEKFGGLSIASGSWDKFRNGTEIRLSAGFDYGLTDRSEVGIEGDLLRHNNPGKTGLGDAVIHFKHMFWEPGDWEPTHSFDFRLTIPTASSSRGLGTGKPDFGAHWLVGLKGDPWETTGQIGWVHTVESNLDKRIEIGVATRYRTNHNYLLLGELYGDSNENVNGERRIIGSMGVAYEWVPTTILDFLLSIGMSNSVPDVGLNVGFRSMI